jgi:predicted  nucleic acid-binding Zn-ribbon protein
MSDRITLERKEFELFLADNQTLLDRSQELMKKIDELEKVNRQLRDELQASRMKLESVEANMARGMRRADDTLRNARETMTRLIRETDKRVSK